MTVSGNAHIRACGKRTYKVPGSPQVLLPPLSVC